ncbi:MAG: EscU/YscU/HrcU family type III secretion system export apparatus switch protein, partial [Aestuariivirgaceae bacterium]
REAPIFTSMMGMVLVFVFLSVDTGRRLTAVFAQLIENPSAWSFAAGEDAAMLMFVIVGQAGKFMIPAFLVLLIAGLLGSVFQNPPSIALERIRPKWSKLSIREGWKRLFGQQGQIEFLKSLFKFSLIGTVALILLKTAQGDVLTAMFVDPFQIPAMILALSLKLLAAICAATLLLAGADVVWSRYIWRHKLRMTRQEVKDEHKQVDGDPVVKARQRSLALDRQRKRMIAQVPRATLVIANPTHYAIALRYVADEGSAPVVLAKGQDLIALKIREVAASHDIPVIEDKPLARSMYDSVEVDQLIPSEFYQAVAELIFYLSNKSAGRRRQTH